MGAADFAVGDTVSFEVYVTEKKTVEGTVQTVLTVGGSTAVSYTDPQNGLPSTMVALPTALKLVRKAEPKVGSIVKDVDGRYVRRSDGWGLIRSDGTLGSFAYEWDEFDTDVTILDAA